MTDITATAAAPGSPRRIDLTSEDGRRRVRARYRAEARFKAMGAIAILLTSVFVVALVGDVLWRGLPAFWQHSIRLDTPLAADDLGLNAKPSADDIRGADYAAATRTALRTAIPGVEGRTAEKRLAGLLSTGAGDELRGAVVADPSLVGKSVKARLLLSDDADLYYKGVRGIGSPINEHATRGIATPSGATGEITILSASNDFADELVAVKKVLAARAAEMRAEASRLERVAAAAQASRITELRTEAKALQDRVDAPGVKETLSEQMPSLLVAINGGLVKVKELGNAEVSGEVLLPLKSAAEAKAGDWKVVEFATPEANRKLTDHEVVYLERLRELGTVERHFNTLFFTNGDSREPELAGIKGSLVGTLMTLFITLVLCLPIGVMAAIYLEEFAPKNWLTEIIEININNLAAVPSIVFGLLGLAVFLNFFDLPRSAPLVGGLVLALLVLPTIIIASRAAIRAVPPSIKEAALGVGASHQQAVFHHVLPLAMPGIMTGTIIGMAHALGETAPLLMIGMIAFIVDIPQGFTQAATVLPVQLYLWSDLPELAFQSKAAALIIVLLGVLFLMNGAAIWLRKKFERRW